MQNHFSLDPLLQKIICGIALDENNTSDIKKDITCPKCEKEYYNLLEYFDSLEIDDRDDELPDYYEIPYN